MAESAADRTAILAAINTAITSVTTPTFSAVIEGVPWAIAQDRMCFYWYAGDEGDSLYGEHALSERQIVEKFMITAFWLALPAETLQSAMVGEAWGACRSIQQALLAHTTLGLPNSVSMVQFQPSRAGFWRHFTGQTFYAVELEMHLHIPSGDTEAQ